MDIEEVEITIPLKIYMNHCRECDAKFCLLGILHDTGPVQYGDRKVDWIHNVGPDLFCPYCGHKEIKQ